MDRLNREFKEIGKYLRRMLTVCSNALRLNNKFVSLLSKLKKKMQKAKKPHTEQCPLLPATQKKPPTNNEKKKSN